jgi:hypothetical protein
MNGYNEDTLQRIRAVAKRINANPKIRLNTEEKSVSVELPYNNSIIESLERATLYNILIDHIENLEQELKSERAMTDKLQNRLFQYNMHHPSTLINRFMFSLYVQAVHSRDATDSEWQHFVDSFDYDHSKFSVTVYDWIDANIRR